MTKAKSPNAWQFDAHLLAEVVVIEHLTIWVAPNGSIVDAMVVDPEGDTVLWHGQCSTVGGAKRAGVQAAKRIQQLRDRPPGHAVIKWHPDNDVYGDAAAYMDGERLLDLVVTPSPSGVIEVDVVEADVLWRGHYTHVGAAKRAAVAAAKRILRNDSRDAA